MAREIVIAPNGDYEIGTGFDDFGIGYVAIHLPGGSDGNVLLTFRTEDFVAFADHLRSVADALVDARAREDPL